MTQYQDWWKEDGGGGWVVGQVLCLSKLIAYQNLSIEHFLRVRNYYHTFAEIRDKMQQI